MWGWGSCEALGKVSTLCCVFGGVGFIHEKSDAISFIGFGTELNGMIYQLHAVFFGGVGIGCF